VTTYRVIRTVSYAVLHGRLSKWATQHQVVDVVPGGLCLAPIRVKVGKETALVQCGRRLPPEWQCEACAVRIELVDVRRVVVMPHDVEGKRAASSSGVA
jgi:hypothetical protein